MNNDFYKQKAVIIFLNHPVAGSVKARLSQEIGNEKAMMVYQELVEHTIAEANRSGAEVFLFYNRLPLPKKRNPKHNVLIQKGKDFGECLKNACELVFASEYAKVLFLGTDCLELSSTTIQMAFQGLTTHDMVIGPDAHSGYYAFGMKEWYPNLLDDVVWSSNSVGSEIIERATAKQITIKVMDKLQNVVSLKDLRSQPLLYNMVNR